MDPDAVELRVLGCLIEKQRTTPDQYPLTVNAVRLAANQSTNRDPVVDYDEPAVKAALERLSRRRWARFVSGHGSRAAKYRHLFDEALGLDAGETAVLAVLMLRGPQTPGELKQRADRLHHFADLAAVQETLTRLAGRELVASSGRRPGQKEERYVQLLGEQAEATAEPLSGQATAPRAPTPSSRDNEERIDRLEAEVRELREDLASLRREMEL